MTLQTLIASCLGDREPLAMAQQLGKDWSAWLQPISEQVPLGTDPAYNDDFQALRDEVNQLSGADIGRALALADTLFTHSCKDLRVATYYLWARLHRDGEVGLADGLSLLATLVAHYGTEVLPPRAVSRTVALQWLTSSKVLDSLALYPEVVPAEAERTVAALAWLQHGLQAWPEAQRPDLDPLFIALNARLARNGGVQAVVPQHTAPQHTAPQADTQSPAANAIKSGRDLLDSGRALASYLRDQPHGWLAAHRLMKSLRWDTVHQVPPQDSSGHTRLAPPRSECRATLKRLQQQQAWPELLTQVEQMFAEGVNHFWLDLQWHLYQALSKQAAPLDGWADIVKRDLGMLLDRLPGLATLYWNDGTPFADSATQEWIAQHVSGNQAPQWLAAQQDRAPVADHEILALEEDAQAVADSDGVEAALAWLADRPEAENGRQRWLLRLLMARVAEQHGKAELAMHLLAELDTSAQHHALAQWEPALNFEVKARLLKLLRLKAQRSDADRPGLAVRMQVLLAALVAIDPVRAAVLCG
jgi:type VI secretion system protein VasJ